MATNLPHDYHSATTNEADNYQAAQQAAKKQTSWMGGLVLILLGSLFLLSNAGIFNISGNWWALFILIPAVTTGATAWNLYRAAGGHLTPAARSAMIGSLILTMVAALFLFNLNWGLLWPVFLIIIGVGALLNRA